MNEGERERFDTHAHGKQGDFYISRGPEQVLSCWGT